MNRIIVTVFVAVFVLSVVRAEDNSQENQENASANDEQIDESESTAKTKRGIHSYGFANGLSYTLPISSYYGLRHAHAQTPYARFPSYYKHIGLPTTYALSPGGASVSSFSVNYPKYPLVPKTLVHKPIFPTVYANRYPLFVQKPVLHAPRPPIVPVGVPTTTFAAPILPPAPSAFLPPPHYHHHHVHPFVPAQAPLPVLPTTTLIAQDGWRPIAAPSFPSSVPLPFTPTLSFAPQPSFTPIQPQIPSLIPDANNRPSISILPPTKPQAVPSTPVGTNFYLPPAENIQQINVNDGDFAHADGKNSINIYF